MVVLPLPLLLHSQHESVGKPNCSCDAFCAFQPCAPTCEEKNYTSFPPNGRTCVHNPVPRTTTTNVSLYRITPRDYAWWIDNTNLGDGPGDMSYIISVRFLHRDGPAPFITRFELDLDGEWGPYEFCNPAPHSNWSGATCNQVFAGNYSYYAPSCRCARANRKVGKISQAFINAAYPEFGSWAARLGGYWFSVPTGGRCAPGATLGDDGCAWRLTPGARPTAIDADCLYTRLDAAARANAAACFATCQGGTPMNSTCHRRCWLEGIDGNATAGAAPLSRAALMSIWDGAFAPGGSGCPHSHPPDENRIPTVWIAAGAAVCTAMLAAAISGFVMRHSLRCRRAALRLRLLERTASGGSE